MFTKLTQLSSCCWNQYGEVALCTSMSENVSLSNLNNIVSDRPNKSRTDRHILIFQSRISKLSGTSLQSFHYKKSCLHTLYHLFINEFIIYFLKRNLYNTDILAHQGVSQLQGLLHLFIRSLIFGGWKKTIELKKTILGPQQGICFHIKLPVMLLVWFCLCGVGKHIWMWNSSC